MKTVSVDEATTQLSELLKRVEEGHEIVITKAGLPVARMIPFVEADDKREFGFARVAFVVPDDFNDPLPGEILDDFYR